jgi:hypothetical protein
LSRWWFSRGFIEEVRGCFGPDSAYELEAGFPLRRVTLFADDCQFLPALRHDPRLDQLEWFHICSLWPFGGGTLRSDDDVIIAAPMNLIVSATLQGQPFQHGRVFGTLAHQWDSGQSARRR